MTFAFSRPLRWLVIALAVGQVAFLSASPRYTSPRFEGRIFATIGADLIGGGDLHKLNEAAHFFGQTIIGWTKFPNFTKTLKEKAGLPEDATLTAHMQERQNIIFELRSKTLISPAQLFDVKNYLQSKLAQYNEGSGTGFLLSNLDYDQRDLTRSYGSGAAIAFLASSLLWLAFFYVKKGF